MTAVLVRCRFLAVVFGLLLSLVAAGPAWGQAVAQDLFTPDNPPNCDRSGDGYGASNVDPNATATDVSLADFDPDTLKGVPDSNECYIEDPPTGPPYGFTILRLLPSNGLTGEDSRDPFEAVANDKYFAFTITANTGYVLNLQSLTFSAARGGGDTPRGWALLSDVDGFTNFIDNQDVPTVRNVLTDFTVDLSGASFQGLTEITFRMYSYAPHTGQSVEYHNLSLNGTVVSQ